jgi:hypothetical protein
MGKKIMGNKTIHTLKLVVLGASLASLGACSSGPDGVRVVNGGTSAISAKEGAPIRNLTSAEISQSVIGKTFQYTRKDGTGFVTYNADGSFNFQDDQKGEGKGTWTANGNQYCESYGAGAAQECGIFKSTGDAFFAANSRLVEMKV